MAARRRLQLVRPSRTAPPEPRIIGLIHRLPADPKPSPPTFPCPACSSPVYDGSIPRNTQCLCGCQCTRDSSLSVKYLVYSVVTGPLLFEDIIDSFSLVCQAPPSPTEFPLLSSLTVGVFGESVNRVYDSPTGIDHSRLILDVLFPWLLEYQRCLAINDMFQVNETQFKVLAAHPPFGLVGQQTAILCYKTLTFTRVERLAFNILQPSDIEESLHTPVFAPYLFHFPRHVHHRIHHSDQYINVNGVECVVTECHPDNGLIMNTSAQVGNTRLEPLFVVRFCPFEDTLPADMPASLQESYLKPYFSGWRRSIVQREDVKIGSIMFKMVDSNIGVGYIGPLTEIILLPRVINREDEAHHDQIFRMIAAMQAPRASGNGNAELLPVEQLTAIPKNPEDQACVICQEDYVVGCSVKRLPCSEWYAVHFFHQKCIDDWLEKSKLCPVCMNSVEEVEGK